MFSQHTIKVPTEQVVKFLMKLVLMFVACLAFLTNEFFDLQIPAVASGHRKSTVKLAQLSLFLMRVWLWSALGSFGELWEALGVSGETLECL